MQAIFETGNKTVKPLAHKFHIKCRRSLTRVLIPLFQ